MNSYCTIHRDIVVYTEGHQDMAENVAHARDKLFASELG